MNNSEIKEKGSKFRNRIIAVVSVLCALFLWIYVTAVESPTSETSFSEVAVSFDGRDVLRRDYDLTLITSADFSADVVLSGKKSTLNQIEHSDIKAYIDLSKVIEAGEYELPVRITAPSGTKLVSCNPQYVTVFIDKTITREFDIEIDKRYSSFPEAYSMGELIITDSSSKEIKTVSVSGPRNEIDHIAKVGATVDFGDIEGSVETRTSLVIYNNLGEGITSSNLKLSVDSVKIKLPVTTTKEVTLTTSQLFSTFSDEQIKFNVNPRKITLEGDPKIISRIDTLALNPINERTADEHGTLNVSSTINLPEGVSIIGDVSVADISVRISANKNRVTLPVERIKLENKSSEFNYSFKEDELIVVGLNSTTSPLDYNDISASVDVSSFTEEGTYTVDVKADTLDGIRHAYVVSGDYELTLTVDRK